MISSRKTISHRFLVTIFKSLLVNFSAALPVSILMNHFNSVPTHAPTTLLLVLHELRLIHTDLKPENILLVKNDFRTVHVTAPGKVKINPSRLLLMRTLKIPTYQRNAPPKAKKILESTEIRLIDFGSATFEQEYHSSVVSTRHYRAPEIILGEFKDAPFWPSILIKNPSPTRSRLVFPL